MYGYKVFFPDWTCRGFQYKVGETFEENVIPSCCKRGFHFCTNLKDCFNYYSFDPKNKVAEIEAVGDIDKIDNKCCTNKIRIIRELTWEEVLNLVNTGESNTGYSNSGDSNSGDSNSGNYNSGFCNSGNYNSGDYNSGFYNSGKYNSGNGNSGNYNSGFCNSGNYNSGNGNSGFYNSGYRNSGDSNSGNYNSGDSNSGNYNSGDYNKCDYSNGCFNTEIPKIYIFNKPSEWTYKDWINSKAHFLLNQIPKGVLGYRWLEEMTDEEKAQHPEAKTTGGYLKKIDKSSRVQKWWNSLTDREKNIIKNIPNFDSDIFYEITGSKIGE